MKELNISQMEAIQGGLSDKAAMCGTIALFGGFFAETGVALICYVAAGALIGYFG